MRKILILFLLLFSTFTNAQTEDTPIVWETSIHKISETEYDVIFIAKLFKGWYLYSQHNPDGASLPLEIAIQEGETGYLLIGKATEKDTFKKYSETWEKEEIVFKVFKNKYTEQPEEDGDIYGPIDYKNCDTPDKMLGQIRYLTGFDWCNKDIIDQFLHTVEAIHIGKTGDLLFKSGGR